VLAITVETVDMGVTVAIGDIDIPCRGNDRFCGSAEWKPTPLRSVDIGPTNGKKKLALFGPAAHNVSVVVHCIDVAVRAYRYSMRPGEVHTDFAPGIQEISILVEYHDWMGTAMEYIYVVVLIHIHIHNVHIRPVPGPPKETVYYLEAISVATKRRIVAGPTLRDRHIELRNLMAPREVRRRGF